MSEMVKFDNNAALARQDHPSKACNIVASSDGRVEMERAKVQARFVMAMNRPRNMERVRTELLAECRDPDFAEDAMYNIPVGKKAVRDLSIRFVEAALSHMGNVDTITTTLFDAPELVRINVSVVDLEKNASYSTDVDVPKTVERSTVKDGEVCIGTRKNAYGREVYIVLANEVTLKRKIAAEVSKTIRTNGLRFIPHWLRNACKKQIMATVTEQVAADPKAAIRSVIDSFRELGVGPDELATWLGRKVDGATKDEIAELRAVYVAIRDGVCMWDDAVKTRTGKDSEGSDQTIRDKIKSIREKLGQPRPSQTND